MTEETQQNQGMNISIEQILAAIINKLGEVTISLEDLVANYSSKVISVNQNEDKSVVFSLVDAPVEEPAGE
jgi:hypothetical protein